MKNQENHTEKLFSYGTLQQENVQLSTFGRPLEGHADIIEKYRLEQIEIKDSRVAKTSGKNKHPILHYTGNTGDRVNGTVFNLSKMELTQADEYEVEDYERISVKLKSGSVAWVYVSKA